VTGKACIRLAAAAVIAAMAIVPSAFAAAETVTVVQRDVDVNPGETNPCTGAVGTIVDDEQDVFHITSLAGGTLHLSGHSTVSVSFVPDDPSGVRYEGHEAFAFSENDSGAVSAITMTTRVRLKGTDGTFLTLGEVAHVTVTAKGVAVDFDRPSLLCS
jgi:hypothetical protein